MPPNRKPAHAKGRLDQLLLDGGFVATIQRARQMILAGEVRVDGQPAGKAGTRTGPGAVITLHPRRAGRVSRGGAKLEGALDAFTLSPAGRVALDIGASTGGFTEALLRGGANRVIALDVGRGQLDWSLRTDPRVIPVEGVNARFLDPAALPPTPAPIDLVTCDVSFISLRLILPAIARILPGAGDALVLVKPQFEAPRDRVGPGGIVRDPADWRAAIVSVAAAASIEGFAVLGVCASPLPGAEGNREFFCHLARPAASPGRRDRIPLADQKLQAAIEAAVFAATSGPDAPR